MAAAAKIAKRACEGTIQAFAVLPETLEERQRLCIGRKALEGDRIIAEIDLRCNYWALLFEQRCSQTLDLYC